VSNLYPYFFLLSVDVFSFDNKGEASDKRQPVKGFDGGLVFELSWQEKILHVDRADISVFSDIFSP